MNIQTSLNMNSNEIQNAVIQPLSIEPSNPKEGQIYYDNKIKSICQYDGETWEKLGGAKEQISVPIPPKSDLNTYTKEGMYYIGADGTSVTNTPFSTNSFSLIVIKNAFYIEGVTQIFIDYQSPKIYSRNYTGQPLQWNKWAGYMINQRPVDVQLPLTPEWQNRHGGCFYNVEQNGRVTITIGATTVDTGGASGSMIIGRLPTEYAPKKTFYFPCVSSYKAITGYVTTSGSVGVLSDELITVAYGQFSFFLQ